jgi:hypothetical protein
MKPLPLLVGGVVLHQGYALVPVDAQPLAWNALGALARLALVLALVYPVTSVPMAAVVAWLTAEELQVAVCNAAFAVRPWDIKPGQEMCSSLIGTDLGKYSAVAVATLLLLVRPNNVDRVTI